MQIPLEGEEEPEKQRGLAAPGPLWQSVEVCQVHLCRLSLSSLTVEQEGFEALPV